MTEERQPQPPPIPAGVPVVPVESLGYGTPWQRGRPGIITAVGVISIIVASLSLLGGFMMGFQLVGLNMMARVARTMPPATPAPAPAPAGTTTAPAPAALGPADVQAVIGQIETAGSMTLTPAQKQAIAQQLSAPGQLLVRPAATTQAVASQIQYAARNPGGEVTFTTAGGLMTLSSTGTVTAISQFSGFGGPSGMPAFSVPPAAAWILALATWVLSVGLAVFLLVCGIATLRQSLSARRMHLIYACLKIPVAIAAGAAMAWMYGTVFSGIMSGSPGGAAAIWKPVSLFAIAPAALGLIYPIALLIVMNTRTVRAYYGSVSQGA